MNERLRQSKRKRRDEQKAELQRQLAVAPPIKSKDGLTLLRSRPIRGRWRCRCGRRAAQFSGSVRFDSLFLVTADRLLPHLCPHIITLYLDIFVFIKVSLCTTMADTAVDTTTAPEVTAKVSLINVLYRSKLLFVWKHVTVFFTSGETVKSLSSYQGYIS